MTPDPPFLCLYTLSSSRGGEPKPLKKSSKGLPLKKSPPNRSQGLVVTVFSVVMLTTEGWTSFATSTKAWPKDLIVVSSSCLGNELARSLFMKKKKQNKIAITAGLKNNS